MKNERKVSKLTYFTLNNYNHTHYELQDMYYENKNFQQYVYLFFCLEQKKSVQKGWNFQESNWIGIFGIMHICTVSP